MITSLLDEIIIAADETRCLEFFQNMKESQRKELALRALQWASALNGFVNRERRQFLIFDKSAIEDIDLYQKVVAGGDSFLKDFKDSSVPIARMAVLATNNLPELKKAGLKGLPAPDQAAAILLARRPAWLDKWCAYILKETPSTHWMALHILEKNGACNIERNSAYWISMLCSLSTESDLFGKVLSTDEAVREEIWQMLEDPGVVRMLGEPEQIAHEIFRKRWNSGANIFASMQVATRKGTDMWHAALVELAEKGYVDRDRLIEYSFTSLAGAGEKEAKKSVYQTVSTAEFAISLNRDLIKANPAPYANRYASLLKAVHKDVSTYASTVLSELPEKSLSVEDICAEIGPAFLNKSKEPAEAALKLLSRLAKLFPGKENSFGPAIVSAFSHTSKDIHKKALALVESTNVLALPEVLRDFLQRVDMIQGMERAKAISLASKYQSDGPADASSKGPAGAKTHDSSPGRMSNDLNESQLYERAQKLDEKLRALCFIDQAVAACQSSAVCDIPVRLDSNDFPRLDPSTEIKPVANLDDLIFMFMKVWSGKCTAVELESVLDGVSRLCNERPADFRQKTEALRQKAAKAGQEYSMFGWTGTLAQLAFSWLGGCGGAVPAQTITSDAGSFFARRCLAVSKRAISKQAAPLLSAPTHAGGWIDPLVLVKRINEYFWIKIEPDRVDFIQALLRLAPDNRAAALEGAASIKGEIGESLRYALGSDSMGRVVTPEYWVAAFRARDPKGTSEELQKLLPKFGPDGAEAAVYGLDMSEVASFGKERYSLTRIGFPNFLPVTSSDPGFPVVLGEPVSIYRTAAQHAQQWANRNRYQFYPTVLLHDNSASWFSGTEPFNWLHNRESLLALYAKRMLLNIDSVGSYWHGDFEVLFDPDISLAENGRYFLCFAMSSKHNDLSRLAVDALIAAVAERRISASGYGEAMAQVLPHGVITAVRWTRGLRDLSRTSPLHAWFVWQSVAVVIENAGLNSTQQIPFLEMLTEIQIEHGFKMQAGLREALKAITGGGKSAKLVKVLLSQESNSHAHNENSAALLCLQARVERVERWQGIACSTKVETFV